MKEVIFNVTDGCINEESIPKGVRVIIKDYDIDGFDPENLDEDDDGRYYKQIFEGPPDKYDERTERMRQ